MTPRTRTSGIQGLVRVDKIPVLRPTRAYGVRVSIDNFVLRKNLRAYRQRSRLLFPVKILTFRDYTKLIIALGNIISRSSVNFNYVDERVRISKKYKKKKSCFARKKIFRTEQRDASLARETTTRDETGIVGRKHRRRERRISGKRKMHTHTCAHFLRLPLYFYVYNSFEMALRVRATWEFSRTTFLSPPASVETFE